MLLADVRQHAQVEIALIVLVQNIALLTHRVRNLSRSFVEKHWRTQTTLALYHVLQVAPTRVRLESHVLLTLRAKLLWSHFLNLLQPHLHLQRSQH